jgi:hypothetical protein
LGSQDSIASLIAARASALFDQESQTSQTFWKLSCQQRSSSATKQERKEIELLALIIRPVLPAVTAPLPG